MEPLWSDVIKVSIQHNIILSSSSSRTRRMQQSIQRSALAYTMWLKCMQLKQEPEHNGAVQTVTSSFLADSSVSCSSVIFWRRLRRCMSASIAAFFTTDSLHDCSRKPQPWLDSILCSRHSYDQLQTLVV